MEEYLYLIIGGAITVYGAIAAENKKKKTANSKPEKPLQETNLEDEIDTDIPHITIEESLEEVKKSAHFHDSINFNTEGVANREEVVEEVESSTDSSQTINVEKNKKKEKKFNVKRAIIYNAILEPKHKEI